MDRVRIEPSDMKLNTLEELYGKEMSGLLSEGLDWIGRYSRKPRTEETAHTKSPGQAIVAAALHALARQDVEDFSRIHRAANLSYFRYPGMKSWLKDQHDFPDKVLVTCFIIMAWLVVAQRLSPKSPLIVAITELEEKHKMRGMYAQAVASCIKQIWNGPQYNHGNSPKIKSFSTRSSFEEVELTIPTLQDDIKTNDLTHPPDKIDKIKFLVKEGTTQLSNISVKSLFQSAIERESFDIIDTLMKLHGGVKKYDKSISELIDQAMRRKCNQMIRTILRQGLDRHFLDEQGNAPLHIAAATNYLKMVVFLTNAGASVNQANVSGLLPLHLATEPGIISHLLEKGADVDAKTPTGDTALHLAVSNDNKEAVKALLKFGAKRNVINNDGITPLLLASQTDNERMVRLLSERVVIEMFFHVGEPFRISAAKGRLETITEFWDDEVTDNINDSESTDTDYSEDLERGNITLQEQIEELDVDGPIHRAAKEGQLEAVVDMLDSGVPIDSRGEAGYTPLQYAAKYGRLNVVRTLVQRGADINMSNQWNWTPLHHAAHYCRYEITKFLLESGANTQIVDYVYGKTPLSWSTYNNKIIQLFQYKGIYK